jgi:ABC-type transport system substrate-binding protein
MSTTRSGTKAASGGWRPNCPSATWTACGSCWRRPGYGDGLEITIEARSLYLDDAQLVQSQLNEAGFNASIAVSDWAALAERMRANNFDMVVSAAGWYADPDGRYARFYTPEGPANFYAGGYDNPEVTELLDEARRLNDPAERKALYQQVFDIIQHRCAEPDPLLRAQHHGVEP